MSTPKKWTKTDLKSLRGAIDHWWYSMSFYLKRGVTKADVFAAMPEGERVRIVAGHFRGFADMLADRAKENAEAAAHARANPSVWGKSTDDIITRFEGLEREDAKASAKARALADRVEAEGLPPEVATYIPGERS